MLLLEKSIERLGVKLHKLEGGHLSFRCGLV